MRAPLLHSAESAIPKRQEREKDTKHTTARAFYYWFNVLYFKHARFYKALVSIFNLLLQCQIVTNLKGISRTASSTAIASSARRS